MGPDDARTAWMDAMRVNLDDVAELTYTYDDRTDTIRTATADGITFTMYPELHWEEPQIQGTWHMRVSPEVRVWGAHIDRSGVRVERAPYKPLFSDDKQLDDFDIPDGIENALLDAIGVA